MFSSSLLLQLSLTIAALIGTASGSCTSRTAIFYGDLGCIEPRAGPNNIPDSVEKVNTRFFLYTKSHPHFPGQPITASNLGTFNASKGIKVIIHGFTDTANNSWVSSMKNELLKAGDFNIVAVDWKTPSRHFTPNYDGSVANTVVVAAVTRQLLQAMIAKGAKPQQIHLIGHSLGAQISGFIGRDLPNIARISGLDPAGPGFDPFNVRDRLDPTDAAFVDVIHSNAATSLIDGLGYQDTLGHVDFYPNDGSAQPYCGKNTGDSLMRAGAALMGSWNVNNVLDAIGCNHMAAIYYYISSINSNQELKAYSCGSYANFENGLCTSCGSDGSLCRKIGYQTSLTPASRPFYMTTLNGANGPHFGHSILVNLTFTSAHEQYTRAIVKINFNEGEAGTTLIDDAVVTRGTMVAKAMDIAHNPSTLKGLTVWLIKCPSSTGIVTPDVWSASTVSIFDLNSSKSYKFCRAPPASGATASAISVAYKSC